MENLIGGAETSKASLIRILGVVGEEIQDLGQTIEQLQTDLSPLLLLHADDAAHHLNAQSLDLLSQRLHALAVFVLSLETLIPPSWQLDLAAPLRRVTLSDLASRLNGKTMETEQAAGTFELF